jgi:arylsulfatase B
MIKYFSIGAMALGACSLPGKTDKLPNIIVIMADDLGWGDVGYHGSDILTPNLDKLSEEGVILDRFYVAPVCSPTRAGFLTGRYPNRFGLRNTVVPPWSSFGVDTNEEFLPELLEKVGYRNRTVIGKWHLGHSDIKYHPLNRGFTHFYGHYNGAIDYFSLEREGERDWHYDFDASPDEGYATDLATDHAVARIKEYAGESPFFLYVAYLAPHGPLQAKEEDLKLYGFDPDKPRFGSNQTYGREGRGNNVRQTYSAMVTAMDRGIGQILDALKEMGIEDNTLVLFHSDNGAAPGEGGTSGHLRGRKFHEWDGGVRAPALIRWPAGFEGGRIVTQVTGYIDVMPTILDITGQSGNNRNDFDGISILPVLKGKEDRIERNLYLGCGSIVSHDWKLVRATLENPRMRIDDDHLFNISVDPSETTNVREEHPEIYNALRIEVDKFDAIEAAASVPPYHEGREGFVAPPKWDITQYKK